MKVARVIPIFKKGEKDEFTNYRPISLLSSLSKVFEKVMYERIIEHLLRNKMLSANQYAIYEIIDKISQND